MDGCLRGIAVWQAQWQPLSSLHGGEEVAWLLHPRRELTDEVLPLSSERPVSDFSAHLLSTGEYSVNTC